MTVRATTRLSGAGKARRLAMALAGATSLAAMTAALTLPAASAVAAGAAMRFDIPAQDLNQALLSFATRAGLQLAYDPARLDGRRSAAVAGDLTADQALDLLLAGTGFTWRYTGPDRVALEALPEGGTAVRLDPLRVDGARTGERANGPVAGYVATRSAAGTKTDTPLIETPQSVSVVTADQIRVQKASTLADALGYTASVVTMPSVFSRLADDVSIRGFNVANGNTGMLRDGMKLQSNVYDGSQEPYGLERLEVLKGAASVLYGQLGPGGVVNAVTKQPTRDPLHEIGVEYGSYDRIQLQTDHGGALDDEGRWSYRLTALYRDADTWVDEVEDDKLYIAPAIAFEPDDDTRITLQASHQRIKTKFGPPLPDTGTLYPGPGGEVIGRDTFLGEPDYDTYDSRVNSIGWRVEHQASDDVTLRHALRYYRADVTWDYMQIGWSESFAAYLRRASDREEHSTGLTSDNSVEYRVTTGSVDHTLLGGIDLYRRVYDTDRYRGSFSVFDPVNPVYGTDPAVNFGANSGSRTESDQAGLYLQDQMKIADRWVLVLGGRYDRVESDVTGKAAGTAETTTDDAFTGRAGLVYLFDNGVAPYVSFSQSFSPNAGVDRDGRALDPTTGEQVEAGLRWQIPGSETMLSAAVYQLTQDDVVDTDALGDTVQTGQVRARGFEAEARSRFGPLQLIASYAYTDTEITRSDTPGEKGESQNGVPRHMLSVWADVGLDGLGLSGMRAGAGIRRIGSSNLIGEPKGAEAPAYTLTDAMVSIDLAELSPNLAGTEFRVNARNLFDEDYLTCNTVDGCRYGDPRTVIGTLSYRW